MIGFTRFPVTITYESKSYDSTRAFDTVTTDILVPNKRMCIERIPFNRLFAILGEQKNAKATYLLYLETGDPMIPQSSDVTWEMWGKVYKGKVKLTQPLSHKVMGRTGECYIQSDNE